MKVSYAWNLKSKQKPDCNFKEVPAFICIKHEILGLWKCPHMLALLFEWMGWGCQTYRSKCGMWLCSSFKTRDTLSQNSTVNWFMLDWTFGSTNLSLKRQGQLWNTSMLLLACDPSVVLLSAVALGPGTGEVKPLYTGSLWVRAGGVLPWLLDCYFKQLPEDKTLTCSRRKQSSRPVNLKTVNLHLDSIF